MRPSVSARLTSAKLAIKELIAPDLGRDAENLLWTFPNGAIVMPGPTKTAVSSVLVVFSLMMDDTTSNAESKLQDPINASVAEKLFRLDCGRSLANDESVWTPGENVGRSIEFSSTCWLIKHGSEWLLWDTGVPESELEVGPLYPNLSFTTSTRR